MIVPAIEQRIVKLEAEGIRIEKGAGASSDSIGKLEAAVARPLPSAYKEFLSAFGWLSRGDNFVSGITSEENLREGGGSTLFDTESMREVDHLPQELLVIQRHEDGAYCIDLNRSVGADCAVVNFERGWSQGEEAARTFEEWLLNFFLCVNKRPR